MRSKRDLVLFIFKMSSKNLTIIHTFGRATIVDSIRNHIYTNCDGDRIQIKLLR
jgi:hypothetical protein